MSESTDVPVPGQVFGWITLEQLRRDWADAELLDVGELVDLTMAAWEQCHAQAVLHLPGEVEPPEVPYRLRQAQVLQTRALYRARLVGSNDQMGPDGFAIPVYSMGFDIQKLLRPKHVRYIT